MKGIRVLSLLDRELNGKIGKRNAGADITIYSYKQGDVAVEVIEPSLYPEKIHPLVFGLALADFVIFKPELEKKEFGEMLAALILSGKPGMFVGGKEEIGNFIKGSALEKWETIEEDAIKIREHLLLVQNSWKQGETKIIIDQIFSLKSIGVVLLGAISRGTIKVHDELTVYPIKQNVSVKSLQLHDDSVQEISDGCRVGANVKGIDAERIERGFVLGKGIESNKEFESELFCPQFVKDGLKKENKVFAYTGLQFCEARISGDLGAGEKNKLKIICENEIAYEKGDLILIVDPGRKPRVIASGKIL
ncbi:hypothetical protein KJ780_05070 [Candidatus Micrarchaeota archaeon]|nr:hypothetical protein [Candidatus Micrarchaeota archaeon]